MSYRFVACLSRLGTYSATGPVTGEKYQVRSSGDWMEEKDANELVERAITIYCARAGKDISIKPLHYATPTVDDMKRFKEA